MSRKFNETISELCSRDEVIEMSNSDRESLMAVNTELRRINAEQKRKITICDKDISGITIGLNDGSAVALATFVMTYDILVAYVRVRSYPHPHMFRGPSYASAPTILLF